MPSVDKSSPLPAYYQVAQDLRRRLAAGEWVTGERIESELRLAGQYGVSRVTVRQALAELVKDDLLERRHGSGTFVRPQQRPLVYELNLTVGAYAARIRDQGFANRAEVLQSGLMDDPPEEIRAALGLKRGERVVYLVRRVLINERIAALYRSWFSAGLVSGIERSPLIEGSLSDALRQEYGHVPVRSELYLEVVRSTREEQQLLRTSHDVPLLSLTSTSLLEGGRPLEYARMIWSGDRVRFHVTSEEAEPHGG